MQIVGTGNQKTELVNYVKELKISKNVDFKGQIKQKELMKCFKEAHIFLFPTLESAGFVILEAMNNYLPILALDYGGPKQFVKENINLQLVSSDLSIEEIEDQLANKILELYKNSELRIKIGLANFKTVGDNFTWENKVKSILNIYAKVTLKQDLE